MGRIRDFIKFSKTYRQEMDTAVASVTASTGKGSGLDADLLDGLDSSAYVKPTNYATSRVGGTVKAKLVGTILYMSFDGTNL